MNSSNIDPFSDEPAPEGDEPEKTPEREPRAKKKKRRLSSGRKVAYAAVGAAIAVVMMVLTCYLPLTVAPLVMISLCYNVVTEKCGIGYGVMTMLVSVGLGFLCCAANVGVLLIVAVVFVPYSFVCVLLRKFDYSSVKRALIRLASMTVFASLALLFIYLLGGLVAEYVDIAGMIGLFGGSFAVGYLIVNLVVVIVFVCIDLLFINLGKQITKKLK